MQAILATTLIGTTFAVRLQGSGKGGECKAIFRKNE